jgi:hypothetical protein
MSEPENFLARWSRLKHAAAVEASEVGRPAPVETPAGVDEPPVRAFDPASLPSIESIDAATDIRAFLESCVPDELTRAALRSTWSADPAIRDFVGIAESQWDFNDPASIPGFAVHAGADSVFSLVVQGVATLSTEVGTTAESSPMVVPPVSQGTCGAATDEAHEADLSAAAPADDREPLLTHSHGGALPR